MAYLLDTNIILRFLDETSPELRLAATAKAHDIEYLLTLNGDDFKRFDLSAIHPNEVVT